MDRLVSDATRLQGRVNDHGHAVIENPNDNRLWQNLLASAGAAPATPSTGTHVPPLESTSIPLTNAFTASRAELEYSDPSMTYSDDDSETEEMYAEPKALDLAPAPASPMSVTAALPAIIEQDGAERNNSYPESDVSILTDEWEPLEAIASEQIVQE